MTTWPKRRECLAAAWLDMVPEEAVGESGEPPRVLSCEGGQHRPGSHQAKVVPFQRHTSILLVEFTLVRGASAKIFVANYKFMSSNISVISIYDEIENFLSLKCHK